MDPNPGPQADGEGGAEPEAHLGDHLPRLSESFINRACLVFLFVAAFRDRTQMRNNFTKE